MKRSLARPILAVLLLGSVASPVALGAATSSEITAVEASAKASVTYLTALSGSEIARLATGLDLELDGLPANRAAQVLEAAALVGGGTVSPALADPPVGSKRVLSIRPEHILRIRSASLGERAAVVIPLSFFVERLRAFRSGLSPNAAPRVPDPPTLQTLAAAAPTEESARIAYWGRTAFSLTDPVGRSALTNAGSEIPFIQPDFNTNREAKLSALTPREQEFVARTYTSYCVRAAEIAEAHKGVAINQSGVYDGVSGRWITNALPVWSALTDPQIQLGVEYEVRIDVRGTACNPGFGWFLESRFYQSIRAPQEAGVALSAPDRIAPLSGATVRNGAWDLSPDAPFTL